MESFDSKIRDLAHELVNTGQVVIGFAELAVMERNNHERAMEFLLKAKDARDHFRQLMFAFSLLVKAHIENIVDDSAKG